MYSLVLVGPPDRPVHVFLARPSKLGAVPVRLTLLAIDERAGQPHAPAPIRRVVGRNPMDPGRFIEFASEEEALHDGFEPVGPYRVCDVWDDYLDPWPVPEPTEGVAATIADGQTDSPAQRTDLVPGSGQWCDGPSAPLAFGSRTG